MDPTTWNLPADIAPALRLAGRVAHLVLTLMGAAQGAPRTVSSWSDGTSWRAESDTGALWVDGPDGIYWRWADEQAVWFAPPESGAAFRHPLPEVNGLTSAHDAALWLGKAPPTVSGTRVDAATGRSVTEHSGDGLRVSVDDETGLVLDVSAEGPHGRMEMRTESLTIGPADADLFGPVAGAVPWTKFSREWEPADESL